MNKFTPEEQTILLEAARAAFADANVFDDLANHLDLSDEYMVELREKLQTVLGYLTVD